MIDGKKYDKFIVISGINLFEGGPLSVYYDCLDAIIDCDIYKKNKIVAFVHKKALFEKYSGFVKLIELPKSRVGYLHRIYYEYYYFFRFSKTHNIDIWISLHDITPRVKTKKLYTYCHNAIIFMKKDIRNVKYNWKETAFSYFYKYLYKINIKKTTSLIVQQEWMRKEFKKLYGINNIIVANPNKIEEVCFCDMSDSFKNVFIYASLPRFFKNFEILLEACKMLETSGISNYELWITMDGTENEYAEELKKQYGGLKNIIWIGRVPREKLFKLYEKSNYLVFPSKLESWGLPISEYKMTGKPVILSDLPYAHEAIGEYDNVAFFNPEKATELYKIMRDIIQKKNVFKPTDKIMISQPYFGNWKELVENIFI